MTEDQYPPSQFMSITPSELFYRNRQMAGFGNPVQAVVSCVRELVENSLDACEDAGVPPVVLVRIDSHENGTVVISVADNGTGVPDEHVAESFAQVLYGSKYSFRQKRGSLGLGVTMAVLYSQITTGCPVEVHTSTVPNQGRVYRLLIDIEKNIPIVESVESVPRDHPGTTVSLKIKGDLARSRARLLDYVRLTSVSAPHARVQLVVDGVSQGIFGPWVDKIPPPTVPMRPHPRSADPELIRRLVANTSPETKLIVFLTQNFQCMSRAISRRFLGFIGIDPSMRVGGMTRSDLLRLSQALRSYDGFPRPSTRFLSPIGKESFLRAVVGSYKCETAYYESERGDWDGNPFVVEAVGATSSEFQSSDFPLLFRFANRTPLLYDASEDVLTRALKRVNWPKYGIGTDNVNVALFVHVCSSRIPYHAAGKHSIAAVEEIEDAAVSLFRRVGRRLRIGRPSASDSPKNTRAYREFVRALRLIAHFGAQLGDRPVPDINVLLSRTEANEDE